MILLFDTETKYPRGVIEIWRWAKTNLRKKYINTCLSIELSHNTVSRT